MASHSIRRFTPPEMDLNGANVLVTGGTGSFGQHFVRTILERFKPNRLVVLSRDELKQFEMAQRFSDPEHPCMRYFIGDVRDQDRLEMAMRGIDFVIHTAALKQVPVAEYNPFECIATNVMGAENVVKAAIRTQVKSVLALSTDKAANPINLYGASKLAADKIFIAANNLSGRSGPHFSVVRYGNVLGSRGSVVPLFQKLIREDAGALPITDSRMTRFWITLGQGVDFVLFCLSQMQGGEIFVPKIPSMRIDDLARALAPHKEHHVIGIRPGEKLHEIMITEDDGRSTLEFDKYYVIQPTLRMWTPDKLDVGDARPVADGFSYTSDTNTEWLTPDLLAHHLGSDDFAKAAE